MAQVEGKKIQFTEDDFYKTLRENDKDVLKQFNKKELSDDDYFFCGIHSDIVSNALSVIINRLSNNSESIGIDNNCRAIIEAFVVLKMDAKGEISKKQKELYRYQYALVDFNNFKKAISPLEKDHENYKELLAAKEKATAIAIDLFNCKASELKNYDFSADDPGFYLKQSLNEKVSFARFLADNPIFDVESLKIYNFFSLFAHPRLEMKPDSEKAILEMRNIYIEKVLNYVFEYLSDIKFLIKDDKLNSFNEDFWLNPMLVNNVKNVKIIEETMNGLTREICKFPTNWDAFTYFYIQKMKYLILDMELNVSLGYGEQTCSKLKSFIEYSAVYNALIKSKDVLELENLKRGYWYNSRLQLEEYLLAIGVDKTGIVDSKELNKIYDNYYKEKYNLKSFEEFEKHMRENSLYFMSNDKKSYGPMCKELIKDVFKNEEERKSVDNIYQISKDMNHSTGYNFNASEGIWLTAPHRTMVVVYKILIYFILLSDLTLKNQGFDRNLGIYIQQLKLIMKMHEDEYIRIAKEQLS